MSKVVCNAMDCKYIAPIIPVREGREPFLGECGVDLVNLVKHGKECSCITYKRKEEDHEGE